MNGNSKRSSGNSLNRGDRMWFNFHTLYFLYKNIFHKNIEAEICEILRIIKE